LAFVGEVVERRDELAVGEVTGGAEDNDHARFRRPLRAEAFLEWICWGSGLHNLGCPRRKYHTGTAQRKRTISGDPRIARSRHEVWYEGQRMAAANLGPMAIAL
jgi:hypothetical protein